MTNMRLNMASNGHACAGASLLPPSNGWWRAEGVDDYYTVDCRRWVSEHRDSAATGAAGQGEGVRSAVHGVGMGNQYVSLLFTELFSQFASRFVSRCWPHRGKLASDQWSAVSGRPGDAVATATDAVQCSKPAWRWR